MEAQTNVSGQLITLSDDGMQDESQVDSEFALARNKKGVKRTRPSPASNSGSEQGWRSKANVDLKVKVINSCILPILDYGTVELLQCLCNTGLQKLEGLVKGTYKKAGGFLKSLPDSVLWEILDCDPYHVRIADLERLQLQSMLGSNFEGSTAQTYHIAYTRHGQHFVLLPTTRLGGTAIPGLPNKKTRRLPPSKRPGRPVQRRRIENNDSKSLNQETVRVDTTENPPEQSSTERTSRNNNHPDEDEEWVDLVHNQILQLRNTDTSGKILDPTSPNENVRPQNLSSTNLNFSQSSLLQKKFKCQSLSDDVLGLEKKLRHYVAHGYKYIEIHASFCLHLVCLVLVTNVTKLQENSARFELTFCEEAGMIETVSLKKSDSRKAVSLENWDFSTEKETGEKLSEIIELSKNAMDKYGTTVYCVVSDNAANMMKIGRITDILHLTCNSHTGQLLAKDVLPKAYLRTLTVNPTSCKFIICSAPILAGQY
nr:unnamed protein product [Callosobruchus analis]